jgi:hypothetical protein
MFFMFYVLCCAYVVVEAIHRNVYLHTCFKLLVYKWSSFRMLCKARQGCQIVHLHTPKIRYILEGLGMENMYWYILWSFGILYIWLIGIFLCYLVSFSSLGMLYQETSGNPEARNWWFLTSAYIWELIKTDHPKHYYPGFTDNSRMMRHLLICRLHITYFIFVQGCQMVSFQTKNPNLGKFWRAWDWKM